MINLSYEIIPNFTLKEVRCHGKGRNNTFHDCGLIIIYIPLLICLNNTREEFGRPIIVNSWSRCEKHNKEVGGVVNSNHKYGKAVDLTIYGGLTPYFVDVCKKHFPRVLVYWDKGFCHCDLWR